MPREPPPLLHTSIFVAPFTTLFLAGYSFGTPTLPNIARHAGVVSGIMSLYVAFLCRSDRQRWLFGIAAVCALGTGTFGVGGGEVQGVEEEDEREERGLSGLGESGELVEFEGEGRGNEEGGREPEKSGHEDEGDGRAEERERTPEHGYLSRAKLVRTGLYALSGGVGLWAAVF